MHFSSDTISHPATRIPAAPAPAGASPAPAAKGGATWWGYRQPASTRVLIIDDDDGVRQLGADLLAKGGFEVDTADDGETGWKAICFSSYDLVITDNDMPRLTGLELIRRMRAVSFDQPCILVSGRITGQDETLVRTIQPGAVLPKPFLPAVLIAEAERLLRARLESALNEDWPLDLV